MLINNQEHFYYICSAIDWAFTGDGLYHYPSETIITNSQLKHISELYNVEIKGLTNLIRTGVIGIFELKTVLSFIEKKYGNYSTTSR